MKYKLTLKKIIKHFNVVNKHRFKVFCLCCKVGIPIQGLLHDLSKYRPVEFFESAKYFTDGKYSPIKNCKMDIGYSKAWIHHKNHNKHHYEYWYDYTAPMECAPIPFKYFLEMVCDSLAAGMIYQGKDWHQGYQLEYWKKAREKARINDDLKKSLDQVYKEISKEGINKVLKKSHLKEIYTKNMKIIKKS